MLQINNFGAFFLLKQFVNVMIRMLMWNNEQVVNNNTNR
jgi:hypothetical protein